MSRRPRRRGIKFIENEKDRHLTYFKRRPGLYKSVADLSTFTGAKIAFVAEAESGKKSAFGTPSVETIRESFISKHKPHIDEEENAKITDMQDELFHIRKDKGVNDKGIKESKTLFEAIQDNPGIDQLVPRDVEDLDADELSELFQGLAQVCEDFNNDQANPNEQLEVSRKSGPLRPPSSTSWHCQIKMPPRNLPWVSLQESLMDPQSSWVPLQQQSRSQSSLFHQTTVPSTQAAPPFPNEVHQYNYYFPQPPSPLPSTQPCPLCNEYQPLSSLLPLQAELPLSHMTQPNQNHSYNNSLNVDPVAPNRDHENCHNFATGQLSSDYQWPPVSPCNELYYDPSFHAQSAFYGLPDDYQGHNDETDPSSLHAQADDDWLNFFGPPFDGEGSGDGA